MVHQSPHIALLPRSVVSNRWVVGSEDDGPFLAQIAPLFIKVSTLYLVTGRLPDHSSQNFRRIAEGFPSLRHLSLDFCTTELHILSTLFHLHPTLRILSFYQGKISSMQQHRELLPLRRLQHLQVTSTTNIFSLIPLLVQDETPLARIERLELISFTRRDNVAACTLLYGLRHVLQVLKIGLSWFLEGHIQKLEGVVHFSPYITKLIVDWILAFMKCLPLEQLTALRELVTSGAIFRSRDFRWVAQPLEESQ